MALTQLVVMTGLTLTLVRCAPAPPHEEPFEPHDAPHDTPAEALTHAALSARARALIPSYKLATIKRPAPQDAAKLELGRMLFFDPIVSGNQDTSCSTCHRMDMALVDGLAIPVGSSAIMRQGRRVPGPGKAFMVRNVPDLFNRGQEGLRTFFWDARLERLEDGLVVLHDKGEEARPNAYLRVMPDGLDSLLAAQNMLPVLNRDELRGIAGDVDVYGQPNTLALIGNHDLENVWRLLFERIWSVPAYQQLIQAAYPDRAPESLSYVQLANAMSAFIIDAFTFDDSPYDRFLRGEDDALTEDELRGMTLFFGPKAMCGQCHHGQLLTDERFHNIAVRPITRGNDPQRGVDLGAMHHTNAGHEARFAFRTPPLRNVALTAPYFHNGGYLTLEQVIDHKDHALAQFWAFDPRSLSWEFAEQIHTDKELLAQVVQNVAPQMQAPLGLTAQERQDLISFLKALTSPSARALRHIEPDQLPSGLPLPRPEFTPTEAEAAALVISPH